MNCLDVKARSQIIRCLIEGCSVRATSSMTGASKNTIIRLLGEIGCACAAYHNRYVRDLRVRRLQCDEVWQFVGCKIPARYAEENKKARATFGLGLE